MAHGSIVVTATARSIPGTLRQEVVIDGKHRLITDEPESVGGDGCAPAPHELFPAALASCISTTLVMYARTKSWDLGEVVVDVDYDHHATPRLFEIAIRLTGDLTEEQLERLEKVAAACPVRRSIETEIRFRERIDLDGIYAKATKEQNAPDPELLYPFDPAMLNAGAVQVRMMVSTGEDNNAAVEKTAALFNLPVEELETATANSDKEMRRILSNVNADVDVDAGLVFVPSSDLRLP